MNEEVAEKSTFIGFSILAAILTLAWCFFLGGWNAERVSMALITCSAAFAIGSLIGFLFTIFGEEVEPFGKIRNAMIAVASGIAGVGIAKVNELGSKLGEIQLFGNASQMNSWFSTLFVITYMVAGFYFMYLLRQLVLNPALAKSRNEIDRIQLSGRVENVAIELAKVLTPRVLLGREDIAEIVEEDRQQAKELRTQLYSDVVTSFLDGCERDLSSGYEISPDNISRAAVIHYYRSYFEKADSDAREKQEEKAVAWINRALLRDPLDPGFNIKLADIYAMQDRYAEVVAIFERLERDETSPQYVQQWLGYFLLFIDGREMDAIRHSLEYHERFPDESAGLFNASCGYAQLYTLEARKEGTTEIPYSKNRQKSLEFLEQSIHIDPGLRADAKRYSEEGESFELLAQDEAFKRIIAEPQAPKLK
jgi:tetratricopeptide (TPR) repeat protein